MIGSDSCVGFVRVCGCPCLVTLRGLIWCVHLVRSWHDQIFVPSITTLSVWGNFWRRERSESADRAKQVALYPVRQGPQ